MELKGKEFQEKEEMGRGVKKDRHTISPEVISSWLFGAAAGVQFLPLELQCLLVGQTIAWKMLQILKSHSLITKLPQFEVLLVPFSPKQYRMENDQGW